MNVLKSGGGMRDKRFEVENATVKATLNQIANRIGGALSDGWGFVLMLMEYGPGGSLFYLSSAERGNVLDMVQEWIDKERAKPRQIDELNPNDPTTKGIRHQWHKIVAMLLLHAAKNAGIDPFEYRVQFDKAAVEALAALGDVAVAVKDDADGLGVYLTPESTAREQIASGVGELSPPPTKQEIEEAKREQGS